MHIVELEKKFNKLKTLIEKVENCSLLEFFNLVCTKLIRELINDYEDTEIDNIPCYYRKKFKERFPYLVTEGIHILGIGDTRVVLDINGYAVKIDHAFESSINGNKSELANWMFLKQYSKNRATLFINPIMHTFISDNNLILVYKKCTMKPLSRFSTNTRSSFKYDLEETMAFISNDYSELNIGFFDKYPIFIDTDKISSKIRHSLCDGFNAAFDELKSVYPVEMQKYKDIKNSWLKN